MSGAGPHSTSPVGLSPAQYPDLKEESTSETPGKSSRFLLSTTPRVDGHVCQHRDFVSFLCPSRPPFRRVLLSDYWRLQRVPRSAQNNAAAVNFTDNPQDPIRGNST